MHELNSFLLRKFLSFTMCFFTLFFNKRTEKISIIYYVLSHFISWWAHWENLYHLLCAFSFYFSIFFENTHEFNSLLLRKSLSFTMCFLILFSDEIDFLWKHDYELNSLLLRKFLSFTMCFLILFSDELDFLWKHNYELNSLLLRKSLSFTMCFLILFLNERTEKISIIYYVLSHCVFQQAHCHWETLYYFVCAFSSYSSTSALSLRKSLLFNEYFLSYWCSRLDIDSDHDRCQVISWNIEKISII